MRLYSKSFFVYEWRADHYFFLNLSTVSRVLLVCTYITLTLKIKITNSGTHITQQLAEFTFPWHVHLRISEPQNRHHFPVLSDEAGIAQVCGVCGRVCVRVCTCVCVCMSVCVCVCVCVRVCECVVCIVVSHFICMRAPCAYIFKKVRTRIRTLSFLPSFFLSLCLSLSLTHTHAHTHRTCGYTAVVGTVPFQRVRIFLFFFTGFAFLRTHMHTHTESAGMLPPGGR